MLRPYKTEERDHIQRMVNAAAFALQPDVVQIAYNFGEDHSEQPCINFHIVVQDRVVKNDNFDRWRHIEKAVELIVEPDEYGLMAYYNVRTKSEHTKRPDPHWGPTVEVMA